MKRIRIIVDSLLNGAAYDESQHPRDPETGEWTSTGGAPKTSRSEEALKLKSGTWIEKDSLKSFKSDVSKMSDEDLKKNSQFLQGEYFKDEEFNPIESWYNGGELALEGKIMDAFELDPAKTREAKLDPKFGFYRTSKPADNENMQKIYLNTQEFLARNPSKSQNGKIKAYRGVDGKTKTKYESNEIGDSVEIETYIVTSWSTNQRVANDFASISYGGVVLEAEIPIEQVFMHYDNSKFGYRNEEELVVISSKIPAKIIGVMEGGRGKALRVAGKVGTAKAAAYDESQHPRDPNTGQWVDDGTISVGTDASPIAAPKEKRLFPANVKVAPFSHEYPDVAKRFYEEKLKYGELDRLREREDFEKMLVVSKSHNPKIANFFVDDPNPNVRTEAAKNADQEGLHKLINDSNESIRWLVVKRIDQAGLLKMIDDPNPMVLYDLVRRVYQEGLHKLLDKSATFPPSAKDEIARRIDLEGLEKLIDMPEYADSEAMDLAKSRLPLVRAVTPIVEEYQRSGKILLSEEVKLHIKDTIKYDMTSEIQLDHTNEFYRLVKDGKYFDFHDQSKQDWEQSSSSDLALLLKDSIRRQYGGEIRYHDDERDIQGKIAELQRTYPKELVDEYTQFQKAMTRAMLDVAYPDTDEVQIYRGTSKAEINVQDFPLQSLDDLFRGKALEGQVLTKSNSLSSWTLKKDKAEEFAGFGVISPGSDNAGVVLSVKVPKDEIWSTFMSHAYHGNEREILVIGKDRVVSAYTEGVRTPTSGAAFDPAQLRDSETGQWTSGAPGTADILTKDDVPGSGKTQNVVVKKLRRIKATMGNRYVLSAIGENEVLERFSTPDNILVDANHETHWNSPVDLVDNKNHIGYEIKTFSKDAKDIKVKTNPEIKSRKEKWALDHEYLLKTVVVVYDKRNKSSEGYIHDGYGGFRTAGMQRLW